MSNQRLRMLLPLLLAGAVELRKPHTGAMTDSACARECPTIGKQFMRSFHLLNDHVCL